MPVDVKNSVLPCHRKCCGRLGHEHHVAIIGWPLDPSPPTEQVAANAEITGLIPARIERRCGNVQPPEHRVNQVDAVDGAVGAIRAKPVGAPEQVNHCTRTREVTGMPPTSCLVIFLRGTSAPTASSTDAI